MSNNHLLHSSVAMIIKNASPIIWYIPGLYSADDPQEKALQLLQTIYPKAEEITNITWENQNGKNIKLDSVVLKGSAVAINDPNLVSNLLKYALDAVGSITDRWTKALDDVKPTAELLAKKIANDLSSRQRQKLILIGHSLGGNIVIRTLANLHHKNLKINSAVLLAAAIDNTDHNILLAPNGAQNPIFSMINPDDTALKIYQAVTGASALGTGCKLRYDVSRFVERLTTEYLGHSSEFYLSQWAKVNNINKDLDPFPFFLLENVKKQLDKIRKFRQ